ncbi:MAG TPA: ATP-binding protein [Caldimonas sp.]|nr:ATP-binding protein [Caldimonas sp.]HEX2542492.1 ATP-binding protein [Caldimonas sp.]
MAEELPELPGAGQIFDEAPCGLLVTTTRGTILQVNRTFCRWVGLTPEELVGRKKLQELFTMGGRIFHQTHWMPMLDMQGSLSEVKFDMLCPDGRSFPVLVNVTRRAGPGGSVDGVSVVVAQERNKYERELLRARKQADELLVKEREAQAALRVTQSRLHQAMQVGAIFVWDIEPQSGRRRFGDEVALLLGFESPRPVDEAAFLACIAPEDRVAELEALRGALLRPEPYRWTYRVDGVDGVRRTVVSSGQGFFDDAGRLSQFVGTLSDISEVSRLRAEAEDRALFAEQMVGIVSHDLRNPLSTVLTAARVLSRTGELSTERSRRMLDSVERAAQRAQRLIEDLLDFTAARIGPGLSVDLRPVDLHHLVERAVEELALAYPARELRHRTFGSGEVFADADRVAQLVGNLVSNALTHGAPDGAVTVTSSVDADGARVTVHNVGEPIPARALASLFEPMVRGSGSDQAPRSVGLGLFIVRAIARAHGGDVAVRSEQDAGTEFVFSFSRRPAHARPTALP